MAGEKVGPNKKYLPTLDGNRALGLILVVFYHMGFTLTRHAWLCISMFFCASGFLITSISVDAFEKRGQIGVIQFWSRRVGRLFPALLLAVLVICIARIFQDLDSEDLFYFREDLIWAIFYGENIHLIQKQEDYFAGWRKPSVVRHLWTLAIEEQYYLVWPLLFVFWTRLFMGPDFRGTEGLRAAAQRQKASHEGGSSSLLEANSAEGGTQNETEMKGIGDATLKTKANEGDSLLKENADEGGQEAHGSSQPDAEESITMTVDPATEPEIFSMDNDPRWRTCLTLLCVCECFVMFGSYLVSFPIIDNLGMSAAYFSTLSRCGDFAAGGLVYLIVHLYTPLKKRIKKEKGVEPMSLRFRIFLEVVMLIQILWVTIPPMTQAPLSDVLLFYFHYFRIPYSFFGIALCVAGTLQTSEPLPQWAVFTRVMGSKFMAFTGIISYSVYIYHWPLILWFGEVMNHEKFEAKLDASVYVEDEKALDPTLALLRDFGLFFLSLFLGTVSFIYFENPLRVLASKQKKHWQVIVCGLSCSVIVACIVVLASQGAVDPNSIGNDYDALVAAAAAKSSSSPATGGSSASKFTDMFPDIGHHLNPVTPPTPPGGNAPSDIDFSDPISQPGLVQEVRPVVSDHRYTPIGFVTPTYSGLSVADILDSHTKPKKLINRQKANSYGDGWPKNNDFQDIINKVGHASPTDTVLFVCRTMVLERQDERDHPCEHDWEDDVTWIWVKSNLLCGEKGDSGHPIEEEGRDNYFERRCHHKLQILDVQMPDVIQWEAMDDTGRTYTGRQDRDVWLLTAMVLAGAEATPNRINAESIQFLQDKYEQDSVWIEQMEQYVGPDGKFIVPDDDERDELSIEFMGDSVAHKIGTIVKEIMQSSVPCMDKLEQNEGSGTERVLPRIVVSNLAMGGEMTIRHFIPCKQDCDGIDKETPECKAAAAGTWGGVVIDCFDLHNYEHRKVVREAIPLVKPDVLILQDGHFIGMVPEEAGLTYETWYLALESWLKEGVRYGLKHAIVHTHSPFGRNQVENQLDAYREFISRNACQPGSTGRLHFTIFYWHLLVCPNYDEVEECAQEQHGFEKILGDKNHPKGPSGNWLVGNMFASTLSNVGVWDLGFPSTESVFADPLLQCLRSDYPPDNAPDLDTIFETHTLCLHHA